MITPYSNTISVTTLEAPLLDTYSGAAAAYSLRLLRSAYTGDAIRVRRASDNTELDIGFVSNELDTSALTTFCSGTNGFVETWYDQSGNARDATQGTVANQPQIVSSGSVILDNGKPTILFDGVSQRLEKSSFGFPTTNISIVKVGSRIGLFANDSIGYSSVTLGGFINVNSNVRIGFEGRPNGGSYIRATATTTPTTDQILQFNVYDGSNMKASFDGGAFSTTAISANPIIYGPQTLQIAAVTSVGEFSNCNNSELVMWSTDESSNRTGIETNINSHYGIY